MRVRGDGLYRSANDRLYAYNPSVVRWRTRAEPRARYVALARATNHQNCYSIMTPVPARDRLVSGLFALVLLDADLRPLPATEAVLDFSDDFERVYARPGARRPGRPRAQHGVDCRLHAGDALHISCNRGVVATLSIRRRDGGGDGGYRCAAPLECPAPPTGSAASADRVVFGSAVEYEVSAFGCVTPDRLHTTNDKNSNLFFAARGRAFLELITLAPRTVLEVDLRAGRTLRTLHPPSSALAMRNRPREDATAEARGGACCLELRGRDGGATFVGVGHYHLPGYQYLQYLYAFRAESPFPLVATSAPFCWRDAAGSDGRRRGPRLFDASVRRLYFESEWPGTIEECAYIQMTTSIVRADAPADAEPRAVVGVGVNDCDAFVATVRIAEIVEVLGINGSVVL